MKHLIVRIYVSSASVVSFLDELRHTFQPGDPMALNFVVLCIESMRLHQFIHRRTNVPCETGFPVNSVAFGMYVVPYRI